MDKLKYFSFIILFVLCCACSKTVKASSVALTQETIEILQNGFSMASYSGSLDAGFLPFLQFSESKDFESVLLQMTAKQDLYDINNEDIIYQELSASDVENLQGIDFYDQDGVLIDNLVDLIYCSIDNGYFVEDFYIKHDGSLVYLDNKNENPACNVKIGGSELTASDWSNIYSLLGQTLSSDSYHYSLDGDIIGDVSYYCVMGQSVHGSPGYCCSVYIANQYQPGYIIPAPNNGNKICAWYFNDPSLIQSANLLGNPGSPWEFHYNSGNYTVGGYNYNYYGSWWNNSSFMPDSANNTYDNWINGVNVGYGALAIIGVIPDNSLLNQNVVSYKKVNGSTLDLDQSYSYGALDNYIDIIDSVSGIPSSSYDYSNAISDTNYPIIFTIEDDIADVVIPFPDVISYDPALTYPESLTQTDEAIIDSFGNLQIPFINNLDKKFPFCIPWDIYHSLQMIATTPEAPAWDFDYDITVLNHTYSTHFEGDLSDFNSLATLFRRLMLISFFIFLCLWSYKNFF